MANVHKPKAKRTRGKPADGSEPKPKKTRVARTQGALENVKSGRPTDYTDELCEVVRLMSRGGATIFEIAQALKVTTQTLHGWASLHDRFFDALYREGRAAFDQRIERTLADRAHGYSYESEKVLSDGTKISIVEHVPPDIGAMKLWLTNRNPAQWAEKQTIEGDLKVETTNDRDSDMHLAMAVLAMLSKVKKDAEGQ